MDVRSWLEFSPPPIVSVRRAGSHCAPGHDLPMTVGCCHNRDRQTLHYIFLQHDKCSCPRKEMTVRRWLERRLAILIATYYAAAMERATTSLRDDEPDVTG